MHSSEIKVVENAFFSIIRDWCSSYFFSADVSQDFHNAVITYILQTMIIIIAIACRDLTSSEIG